MAPCEKGEGDSKQRDRGAAITRRFSGQLEGVAQKGVLPEREGRTHRTPAVRCILDAERRDARIRRILFVVPLLLFKGENIKTMHRQQRLRSPSSSPSSQSLPRFSTSRSSVSSVLLAPAATSTATSAATPTPTPTPASALTATSTPAPIPIIPTPTPTPTKPIASATGPTSSIVLPASSTWSTSKLSPYVWNVQQTSCSSLALLSNESSIAQSTPSTISLPVPCPRLVSVLAWSMTLLLVTSCIGLTDAGILNGHPLGKRSFIDIQCKGIYDKSIFARLDRICEDCYNLFREPQLHQLCRKNCFTSDYFKGCLDVLLLQDEVEKIQTWIKQLHGAEPGV